MFYSELSVDSIPTAIYRNRLSTKPMLRPPIAKIVPATKTAGTLGVLVEAGSINHRFSNDEQA